MQLERRSLKKIRASTGFEPVTSAIPVRCSTNWAMKPHIVSEVNLLSSDLPVQWNDVKFIWNNSCLYCGCRWKWNVIIAVNFPISHYFNIIAVDWPQQAFVSSVKIHLSYVKCELNDSSEQLARHSKATLELRKIKRYRTLNVFVGSF